MNFDDFIASLEDKEPLKGLSQILTGLWYDAKGDWDKAHDLIDGCQDAGASWAHAYLHRKEGDQWNADYWYRRADRTSPSSSLDEEREEIIRSLIQA